MEADESGSILLIANTKLFATPRGYESITGSNKHL
jgi:hypothetical protein